MWQLVFFCLQVYPQLYQRLLDNGVKGNYINVQGRLSDGALASTFQRHWSESAEPDKYQEYTLLMPIIGRPSDLPASLYALLQDSFRSDNHRFWDHGQPGDPGLPALMLSDTGNKPGAERRV